MLAPQEYFAQHPGNVKRAGLGEGGQVRLNDEPWLSRVNPGMELFVKLTRLGWLDIESVCGIARKIA